ncbi:YadA family autotransporter adhesin [Burkholderia sp. F1]|uniref:YadA family autotransporter adhesin n=1 Tax=Burkholderia sp. F1 TaxID=3366817 RepID=UPI003D7167A6
MNENRDRLVGNRRMGAEVPAGRTHAKGRHGLLPRRSKSSLAVLAALMLLPMAQAHADNFAFGSETPTTTVTLGGAASAPPASTGGSAGVSTGADGTSQNQAYGLVSTASGGAALSIGDTVSATGRNATSVGSNSVATGANAVSLGGASVANGGNATALGAQARASGQNTIAIGGQATASGEGVIAIGTGAQATVSGSVALGQNATANGQNGVAVGWTSNASGFNSVALGEGTTATNAGDVALGAGSVTAAANPVSRATVGNTTLAGFAGANPASVVSVGAAGSERQITNVAAGQVSGSSTDAINGSQLYAVARQVDTLSTGLSSMSQKVGSLSTGLSAVNQQVASLTGSIQATAGTASGANSVAVGAGSTASGTNSVATGSGATASGNNSTALGAHAMASGTNSVALGANSTDQGRSNVVSIGSATQPRQLINVAAGTAPTDGVNVQQLNDTVSQGVSQANSYTDGQIQSVNNRIDSIRRDSDGGVASAMAVAGLPQPTQPGMSMVAVAGSVYRGQSGQALGVSHVTGTNRWVYKAAVSTNTRGTYGAVVSGGYQW